MKPHLTFFKLDKREAGSRGVPHTGEDAGGFLAQAAELLLKEHEGKNKAWYYPAVIQLKYLAADAFEWGSCWSIGHNRSDRYLARARVLREEAEALAAELD